MIARWLFLAVLAFALPVRAQITAAGPMATQMGSSYVVSYATNGTPIAAAVRSITATGGEALIRDMFNVSGPAGNLGVTVSRTAAAADVALGLARVASRVAVPLTVGMLAYDMLAGVGVRQGASGAEIDAGTDQVPQNCTGYSVFGGPAPVHCLPAQEACDLRSSYVLANQPGLKRGRLTGSGSTLLCVQETSLDGGLYWNGYSSDLFGNPVTKTGVKMCTPVVDSLTGESSVPGTYSDGKCITGRYDPATESQVQAKILPVAQARTVDALKAAIAAGAAIPATAPVVTGPATQTGQPRSTTTTGPAGQTSTTTTPTYQYNYAGDTITYNITNTTVTTNTAPDGTSTTETKTEDQPKPADTKQLCDTYPDSLACMKPGTPPDAEQIPIDRRPVTITKDPRWASNAGACTRGAIQLTSGASINLWQPFCDFFALIRGVVVGMFGLAGAFIFRNGVK